MSDFSFPFHSYCYTTSWHRGNSFLQVCMYSRRAPVDVHMKYSKICGSFKLLPSRPEHSALWSAVWQLSSAGEPQGLCFACGFALCTQAKLSSSDKCIRISMTNITTGCAGSCSRSRRATAYLLRLKRSDRSTETSQVGLLQILLKGWVKMLCDLVESEDRKEHCILCSKCERFLFLFDREI